MTMRGLIVGRGEDEAHAALLAVDVTEEVLDEAERRGGRTARCRGGWPTRRSAAPCPPN